MRRERSPTRGSGAWVFAMSWLAAACLAIPGGHALAQSRDEGAPPRGGSGDATLADPEEEEPPPQALRAPVVPSTDAGAAADADDVDVDEVDAEVSADQPEPEPAPIEREREAAPPSDAPRDDDDGYIGDELDEEIIHRRSEFALTLAAAGQLTAGLTPGILGAGPSVMIGLRLGEEWSVQLLGSFDHSMIHDANHTGDQLAARVFTLTPEGCYHFAPGMACIGLELGAFSGRRVNDDGLDPQAQSYFFASSDVRGGFEITEGFFFARFLADVRIVWTSIRLNMRGEDVWTIPPIAGSLRVFIGGRIDL